MLGSYRKARSMRHELARKRRNARRAGFTIVKFKSSVNEGLIFERTALQETIAKKPIDQESVLGPCRLLNLPVEIVYSILRRIQSDSLVTVSLTCKDLRYITGGDIKLDTLDYVRFQLRLARDIPNQRYCSDCRRLRRRSHRCRANCEMWKYRIHTNRTDTEGRFFAAHACAVVDRHRLGPGHGLPQHLLQHTFYPKWGPGMPLYENIFWREEQSVQVIDDSLCMRVEHTYRGNLAEFERQVIIYGYWICNHVDLLTVDFTRRVRAISQPWEDCKRYQAVCGTCDACGLDFSMVMKHRASARRGIRPSSEGIQVTVTTYLDLGPCKTIDDHWHKILDKTQPANEGVTYQSMLVVLVQKAVWDRGFRCRSSERTGKKLEGFITDYITASGQPQRRSQGLRSGPSSSSTYVCSGGPLMDDRDHTPPSQPSVLRRLINVTIRCCMGYLAGTALCLYLRGH